MWSERGGVEKRYGGRCLDRWKGEGWRKIENEEERKKDIFV